MAEILDQELPSTFTVESGGKGLGQHWYYQCDQATEQRNWDHPEGGVNVDYWQVVGPGSVHAETGDKYDIIDDRPIARISLEEYQAVYDIFTEIHQSETANTVADVERGGGGSGDESHVEHAVEAVDGEPVERRAGDDGGDRPREFPGCSAGEVRPQRHTCDTRRARDYVRGEWREPCDQHRAERTGDGECPVARGVESRRGRRQPSVAGQQLRAAALSEQVRRDARDREQPDRRQRPGESEAVAGDQREQTGRPREQRSDDREETQQREQSQRVVRDGGDASEHELRRREDGDGSDAADEEDTREHATPEHDSGCVGDRNKRLVLWPRATGRCCLDAWRSGLWCFGPLGRRWRWRRCRHRGRAAFPPVVLPTGLRGRQAPERARWPPRRTPSRGTAC